MKDRISKMILLGFIACTTATANQPLKLGQDRRAAQVLSLAKAKVELRYRKDNKIVKPVILFTDIIKMGKNCFWANIQSGGLRDRNYAVHKGRVTISNSVIPMNCSSNRRKNRQYQLQQTRPTKRI